MMASELTHRVPHSQIPKLDRVVSTARQESIVSILIVERALIKFNRVDVPLVSVTHSPDSFVRIGVVDD